MSPSRSASQTTSTSWSIMALSSPAYTPLVEYTLENTHTGYRSDEGRDGGCGRVHVLRAVLLVGGAHGYAVALVLMAVAVALAAGLLLHSTRYGRGQSPIIGRPHCSRVNVYMWLPSHGGRAGLQKRHGTRFSRRRRTSVVAWPAPQLPVQRHM